MDTLYFGLRTWATLRTDAFFFSAALRGEFLCHRPDWGTFAGVKVPFLGRDGLLTTPEAKRLAPRGELQDRNWDAPKSPHMSHGVTL
ncbi:hypothetical protein PoB_000961500 [Plakobranchus ocellatus]|uniref:Uncharacterized protein n=1 Tax=Plakobranchus ocellatus TaxID=259542 RepID=A0AAV3YKU4_9GAST|nr:hypothetical protein PoB_000961500 [Plakobranchus ocellatus]